MQELPAGLQIYCYGLVFVCGLVMGSFLHCFAYRYIHGQGVGRGRSRCVLCDHTLAPRDLIPLFSWLRLGGRCRWCGGKISPRYPAAELLCGIFYLSVFFRFGLSIESVHYCILASLLCTACFTDLLGGLIPDRLLVIGGAWVVLDCLVWGGGVPKLLAALRASLAIALPLLLVVLLFERLTHRESMGGGDIKLMALIGLFFPWTVNLFILILACLFGILFAAARRVEGPFAFAPALCGAAWAGMFFGDTLLNWYLGLWM